MEYHVQEGKPGLLRSTTGDSLVPEGGTTRVNEVYVAPRFHVGDVVLRVGRKIHGERNMKEPCTVIFCDKFARPFHYTIKDPFGQEIGIAETHLEPCDEVMYLADKENARVCDFEEQRRFPEQETKEGDHQEAGFRVEMVPHRKLRDQPDELELPVAAAPKKRRRHAPDDSFALLVEQICWCIIISMGIFWCWVAVKGPGDSIVPLRSWWEGKGWKTEAEWEAEYKAAEELYRTNAAYRKRVDAQLRYEEAQRRKLDPGHSSHDSVPPGYAPPGYSDPKPARNKHRRKRRQHSNDSLDNVDRMFQ